MKILKSKTQYFLISNMGNGENVRQIDGQKLVEIDPPFFHQVVGHSVSYLRMSMATLYLITLTFYLKVKDSNLRYFGS